MRKRDNAAEAARMRKYRLENAEQHRAVRRAYRVKNRDRLVAQERARREVNKDRYKNYHLKAAYGITTDEVDTISAHQGCRCASCRELVELHVDHNHVTGDVRGLLCGPCNRALGLLKEDPMRIRALAVYIETRMK